MSRLPPASAEISSLRSPGLENHPMRCRIIVEHLVAIAVLFALLGDKVLAASGDPPNFVFILVDDQAWSGTSVAMIPSEPRSRTAAYQMPNLDRLAAEGMTFSQAYSPHPKCEGTRYSLQFGKTTTSLNTTDKWVTRVNARLEDSLANALKRIEPRYRAAFFGKWQLIYPPEQLGYNLSDGITQNEDGDSPDPEDPKRLFSMTRRAGEFIEQQVRQKHPFFLQLSYYAVHNQPQALEATLKKYTGTIQSRPGGKGDRAVMAAMTEDLDTCIGQMLAMIDQLGIVNNTYVIYMSDNGGRNALLKGGKTLLWEGGIRVPLIVRGPGIKGGVYCNEPVIGYDLMPTVLDFAKPESKPPAGLEGGSWKPVLMSGGVGNVQRPIDRFVFHHTVEVEHPQSALRQGDYKLLYYWDTRERFLFDVASDLGEEHNLAQDKPDLTDKLERAMRAHLLAGLGAEAVAKLDHATTGSKQPGGEKRRRPAKMP
jgi:arylsulfatase A